MHAAGRRNRKRVPTSTIWLAAIAAALLVHGTVLGAAEQMDLLGGGLDAKRVAMQRPTVELVDLETSCRGDVLLATSARAALCMAPWRSDRPECSEDLQLRMWMDLSACEQKSLQTLDGSQVAVVEPRQLEKLTPIDAESLIEELQPPETPPQPPPQLQQPQPQPPPPPQQAPPPPPRRPQQVVETVKPNSDKEPDNARFLSENNVVVDKQKVARGATKEPMVAKPKDEALAIKDKPKDDPATDKKPPEVDPGKNPKAPPVPGTLAMRPPGSQTPKEAPQDARIRGDKGDRQPVVSDGFIPRRGDGAVEQQRRDPGQQTNGGGGAGGGPPVVPNLKPSKEVLERIAGGGSVDHLEEVENGDETALNAKRWVFASFFNRLKRQVAQNWDPQTVWRRTDPNGAHHGFKTRITEVRVVLSGKGELNKIVVTAPSGVVELDEEALRSFHAAAPFPNPPDGLVGKDGTIVFAFSFYFEIGQSHTSWRVIRQ